MTMTITLSPWNCVLYFYPRKTEKKWTPLHFSSSFLISSNSGWHREERNRKGTEEGEKRGTEGSQEWFKIDDFESSNDIDIEERERKVTTGKEVKGRKRKDDDDDEVGDRDSSSFSCRILFVSSFSPAHIWSAGIISFFLFMYTTCYYETGVIPSSSSPHLLFLCLRHWLTGKVIPSDVNFNQRASDVMDRDLLSIDSLIRAGWGIESGVPDDILS